MARYMEISLTKRSARAVARLLDEDAPQIAQAVWDALPLEGPAYHAKYANNEVYTLVKPFATREPGLENATIFPIPGDVAYFFIGPGGQYAGWLRDQIREHGGMIDLAIFYGRNNFLLSHIGLQPGSIFAVIEEGLAEMAEACNDVWASGAVGERLVFRRLE